MSRHPATHLASTAAVFALLTWTAASADAPKLVRSEPADGATDVALDVGVLRLAFDRDMRTDSFTCWKSPQGEFPPVNKDVESRWADARTFELRLQRLKPGTEYFVQLNAEQRQGFRSTGDEPLAIVTVRFNTVADKPAPRQEIYDPGAEKAPPRQEIYAGGETAKPPERGCLLKWNAQPGQVCKVTQTTRVKLNVTVSATGESETQRLDSVTKAQYTDTYLAVESGLPTRIERRIEQAYVEAKNSETGETQRQDLPYVGLAVEIRARPDGGFELVGVKQGDRAAADEMVKDCRWYTLEPGRAVKVGESWPLAGAQLAAVLGALESKDGEVTVRLVKVQKDAHLGQDVAKLEGRIKARMQLPGGMAPELEGTVAIDFVPDLGLPLLRQCKAKLRVDQTIESEGQQVKLVGDGELETVEQRVVGQDAAPVPCPAPGGAEPKRTGEPAPGQPSDRPAARPAGKRLGTMAFQRQEEPNERAFTVLVPQGWRIGGGIVRVNPLTSPDQATQAIAAKCDLVVKKDDAETVGARFLPTVMYADLTGQPAAPMFQPGSVYNGCPVLLKMSATDFLTQALFPRLRPAAQDVRVTDRKSLPQVAAGYKQRMANLPAIGGQFEFDVALVTIEYTEGGTRYRERLYTALKIYPLILWDNNDTLSFRAPAEQYELWEPVARIIIFSLQFNSAWMQREIAGQAQRAGIVLQTQQELQRIDQEITAHRQRTNAEINNDMYLTVTGQEEYVNPYTKEVERDSGDWKYRWVTEGGQIVFSDDPDYNPNHDSAKPFNRSGFKRSEVRPRFPK